MAYLLSLVIAPPGKTTCQINHSPAISDWLEAHCSAEDETGDREIICYQNSSRVPYLHGSIKHRGGLVSTTLVLMQKSRLNCCSQTITVNGTTLDPDSCLDFVDEHPRAPPTTTKALSSMSSDPPTSPTSTPILIASSTPQILVSSTRVAEPQGVTPGGICLHSRPTRKRFMIDWLLIIAIQGGPKRTERHTSGNKDTK